MKKKTELSTEEAFAKLYVSSIKYLHDSTMLTIKFYENKCNRLRDELITLKNNEPFKLFKNAHQQWKTKMDNLQIDYDKATNDLIDEYRELETIIDL